MGERSGMIKWLRQWIADDQNLLDSHKRFNWRVFRMVGNQRVDMTDEHLGDARSRMARNKNLLDACEKDDARGT